MDELLNNMFGCYSMLGNYEERLVCNTKKENFTLDTARVTDREWEYETAVAHKDFRGGAWIVLEGADTKEDAQEVHNKWLEILDRDNYDELYDCYENYTYKKFK